MLIIENPNTKEDLVSIDDLLLKEAKCLTKKDKIVLFSMKNIYLALMGSYRMGFGNKKEIIPYSERGISFQSFLYKYTRYLGMDNLVLKVSMPEHGFQAYCHSNNSFKDLAVMAGHQHNLIKRFFPKEGDVVVDISDHIGLYTMLSSRNVGTNGKVIAITANSRNFDILCHNIKLNNLTNVMPFNYIVYSKEMEMVLVNYSRVSLDEGETPKTKDKTTAVHVNTLDLLLNQNGISEANWIKIDVEGGAELDVLMGATNVLSNSKDIGLLIIVHGNKNYGQLLKLLSYHNFDIEFEKNYEGGDKHIVARKAYLPR